MKNTCQHFYRTAHFNASALSLSYSHIKAITYIYKSILIRIRALYKLDILYKDRKNTGFFFENLIHKQCASLINNGLIWTGKVYLPESD